MHASRLDRWSALSGVLFVILWVAAYLVLGKTVESPKDSEAVITAYLLDEGQRDRSFITMALLVTATLPFVLFVSVLRERLGQAEGEERLWSTAAFGAGLIAAVLWVAAAVLYVEPTMTTDASGEFRPDLDTFNTLGGMGYLVWSTAGLVASLLVLGTSVVGVRTGVIPKWIAWPGFVVALSLLAAFALLPVMLLLAWVLVVSITLFVRPAQPGPPARAAT